MNTEHTKKNNFEFVYIIYASYIYLYGMYDKIPIRDNLKLAKSVPYKCIYI